MLKCLCSSSDRICHPAATEQHRHSLWPRASTDTVPLPLLGYCGKDYHTAISQCGDLGWSTQHIPFSLWTWGSEGPRVLLWGLPGMSLCSSSRRMYLLLANMNITTPASVRNTLFFFFFLPFPSILKAIYTLLRKVSDDGRPFLERGCNSDLSDHIAISGFDRTVDELSLFIHFPVSIFCHCFWWSWCLW